MGGQRERWSRRERFREDRTNRRVIWTIGGEVQGKE